MTQALHAVATSALALSIVATSLVAQDAAPAAPRQPTTADFRAALTELVGRKAPAIGLAVVRGDQILFADAVGKARIRKPALPADRGSRFPLGNVSRVVTDLVIDRMVAAKLLDLDRTINDSVGFEVPGATFATLGDLITGEVRTNPYLNNLPFDALERWPLRGAVRDHLSVADDGSRSQLSYAALQVAMEKYGEDSYANLALEHLVRPLGMDGWVACAREGDTQNVDLHIEGFLGFPSRTTTHYSNLHAAQSNWLTAPDAAALLGELLKIAGEEDLATTEGGEPPLSFASFGKRWDGSRSYMMSRGNLYGSQTRIEIFPNERVGICAMSNSAVTDLHKVVEAVRDLAMPPPDRVDGWNSAVGLGGGAGGRLEQAERLGRWVCELAVRDRKMLLELEIQKRLQLTFAVDGGAAHREFLIPSGPDSFEFRVDPGVVPLREDSRVAAKLQLELSEDKSELHGTMQLTNPGTTNMKFFVNFKRSE